MVKPKTLEYRTGRKWFVYIFFQASSGIRIDQNKGLLPEFFFNVSEIPGQIMVEKELKKELEQLLTKKLEEPELKVFY